MAYKVLGQAAPAADTVTTLYTAPSSAVISTITVCNRGALATSFNIAVQPAAAALSPKHYVAYNVFLEANNTFTFTIGITLSATDLISVYGASADLSFNAFGQEV